MIKEQKITLIVSIVGLLSILLVIYPPIADNYTQIALFGNREVRDFAWFFAEWMVLLSFSYSLMIMMPRRTYSRIIISFWAWLCWVKLLDNFIRPYWHEIKPFEILILGIIILITIIRLYNLWQTKKS